MERMVALNMVRVTEAAALAAARYIGKGQKDAADQASVTAMRNCLNQFDFNGRIVIGEGERDKAPMLYIGEEVGSSKDGNLSIDIAVDPLEGTNLCAYAKENALSVLAFSKKGNLLHAPDIYMSKIAVGPSAKGVIDLDKSPTKNLKAIADAKGVYVNDLTAIILERDRHADLINEVRNAGAKIKLISDGDVSAAISTCIEGSGIDVLFGIGGAPEGVIAAAALRCVGGDMQCRLMPKNDQEKERCTKMGVKNINKKWNVEELAKNDVVFIATGVTNGDILKGVEHFKGGAKTNSLVMKSKTRTRRLITTHHYLNQDISESCI